MNGGTAPSAALGARLSLGAAKGRKLPAGFRKLSQGKPAAQTRKNKPRVGDYRLLCDIQDERITILVLELGHRKDVYR
jgi:mRNA-degrading endonuclease RelE of RelBE toxin-antitoxin system